MKRKMTAPPAREQLRCPFCPSWVWINEPHLMETHLKTDHGAEAMNLKAAAPTKANGQLASGLPDHEALPQPTNGSAPKLVSFTLGNSTPNVVPTFTIETVTPDMARDWLQYNVGNRQPRKTVSARYVEDMLNNRWLLTAEAIKFDTNGILVDGQHRLMACVKSNTPFTTAVARGVSVDAQVAMDTGVKRSLADILKKNGEANRFNLGAAIVIGWRWDQGIPTSTLMPTVQQALEWLDKNPLIRDAIRLAAPLSRPPLHIATATTNAVLHRAMLIDLETAELFVQAITSDTNLKDGDAILAFRRWASRIHSERSELPTTVRGAFLVKAWNGWITNAHVKALHVKTRGDSAERFPQMLDLDGVVHPFPDVLAERQAKAEARAAKRLVSA